MRAAVRLADTVAPRTNSKFGPEHGRQNMAACGKLMVSIYLLLYQSSQHHKPKRLSKESRLQGSLLQLLLLLQTKQAEASTSDQITAATSATRQRDASPSHPPKDRSVWPVRCLLLPLQKLSKTT
jgi:hypothetical protein